jgi:hypothetical protein
MADRGSDESLGPKRLCETDDYAEPTLSSRVPAHMRSVIAVARRRSVADPGCSIRTPDHLSVLVTTFFRRGKPLRAPPRKKREPLTSRNRVVSRRRNSAKVVVHTISGFRGRDRVIQLSPETTWKAGLRTTPVFQHHPGTAKVRPERALIKCRQNIAKGGL